MKPNSVEPLDREEIDIDSAAMPAIGRSRRKGKILNWLALTSMASVGVAWAVIGTNDPQGAGDASKPRTTDVANRLAPLTLPDKPPPVDTAAPMPLLPPPLPPPLVKQEPGPSTAQPPAHVMTWQERKLGFSESDGAPPSTTPAAGTPASAPSAAQGIGDDRQQAAPGQGGPQAATPRNPLAQRLESGSYEAALASRLPDLNYLITAGTLLDCVLDTRIDSTLPGLVKCHLDRDQYSDNKQVLLMRRGTVLLGELTGGILQGQARQFVLFKRAKAEDGTFVNLNSPATDAMGATGIIGWVDTQFGKRFGAALGIALLQDATAIAVARSSSGGGQNTLVLGNTTQTTGSMAEKTLESSLNIPPILHSEAGAHIQVMLARDLDFSNVYTLQRTTP